MRADFHPDGLVLAPGTFLAPPAPFSPAAAGSVTVAVAGGVGLPTARDSAVLGGQGPGQVDGRGGCGGCEDVVAGVQGVSVGFLASREGLLGEAHDGRGRLVCLGGEAGGGKTTVAAAVAHAAGVPVR